MLPEDDALFRDAVAGLEAGDFSRLAPLFAAPEGGGPSRVVAWHAEGRFRAAPTALDEALTCACFLGEVGVAEYLLDRGVDPGSGMATGLNAFHWAGNRGQLAVVRLLLRHKAALETRNVYGGSVLGTVVWSAIHEPRPDHVRIIGELLDAGARRDGVEFPTGDEDVDALLGRGSVEGR